MRVSARGAFGRLIREPLIHFFLIGTAVFALYGAANDAASAGGTAAIEVTSAMVDRMQGQFEAVWRRPPTETERAG